MRVLNLTQKESELPPWQQMRNNRALNDVDVNIVQDEDTDDENPIDDPLGILNFSDEEELEEQDGQEFRHTPYAYQEELAEPALAGQNIVIVAPTGSGKTTVAVNIIMKHLQSREDAKIAFLARSVPLAKQQYKCIKRNVVEPDKVLLLTGADKESMSLHAFLPRYSVAVLTPQILVNHLQLSLLPEGVSSFTMLIFDECHHTREGEPYNGIMGYYLQNKRDQPGKSLPQIVGLTASIGVEKAENIDDAVEGVLAVCGNLDAIGIKTVRENIDELQAAVPPPRELPARRLTERQVDEITQKLRNIMGNLEQRAKEYGIVAQVPEISRALSEMPDDKKYQGYCNWAVKLGNESKAANIQQQDQAVVMAVRNIIIIADYLKNYHFALESTDLAQVQDVMDFLNRCFRNFIQNPYKAVQEDAFFSHFTDLQEVANRRELEPNANLDILSNVLRDHVCNTPEGRALIFVRTRMLATAIASWLNRCGEDDLVNLNARKFTSTNVSEADGGMLQSQQDDVLNRFRLGDVRVLLATMGDEGLDIPQCNLIVKYNVSGNEVKLVQQRGRSRAIGGCSILLGLDNILMQEVNSQFRVRLMEQAISRLSDLFENNPHQFRQRIEEYQQALYETWDQERAEEALRRAQFRDVPFNVKCHSCMRVGVDSTSIRTIYGKYRVSIDRALLDNIIVIPITEETMDELTFVGNVICLGETEAGSICHNKIGVMIKHRKCPFVTLGVKNLKFQTGVECPRIFKQWKKVPYFVQELSIAELEAYARSVFN